METELRQCQDRQAWADLCRVVSMYGVVLIHSCGAVFYAYGQESLGNWLSANFLDSLARCSVPLFVMLSGAMLLRPGIQVVGLPTLARRISKIFVPLLVWTIAFLMYVAFHTGKPVDWGSLLIKPAMYHLWFVWMLIGIYILLPVYQGIFSVIQQRRDVRMLVFAFWTYVTLVPVYWQTPLAQLIQQSSFLGYGGYFLLGATLAASQRILFSSLFWFIIYLIAVLITFGLTWHYSVNTNAPNEQAYLYTSMNVAVASVAAFIVFVRARVSRFFARKLEWISDKCFLIFFVHVVSLEIVRTSSVMSLFKMVMPTLLVILATSVMTFILSLMIAVVIRLIPGTRHVLG